MLRKDVESGFFCTHISLFFPPSVSTRKTLHGAQEKWNGQELIVCLVFTPVRGEDPVLEHVSIIVIVVVYIMFNIFINIEPIVVT